MSISPKKHLFFVRPDNFHFKDDRQNMRVFYATSGQDLLDQVIEHYKMENVGTRIHLELWSHQIGMGSRRVRLDTMTEFVKHESDVWIRIIPISSQPHNPHLSPQFHPNHLP